ATRAVGQRNNAGGVEIAVWRQVVLLNGESAGDEAGARLPPFEPKEAGEEFLLAFGELGAAVHAISAAYIFFGVRSYAEAASAEVRRLCGPVRSPRRILALMSLPRVSAAVLIIGDEILSGRTQDTNLSTITKFLAPLGVQVVEARVVPDIPEEIV